MTIATRTQFRAPEIIAIGASTGGTEAVRRILCDLPDTLPPIVVTVHMPEGFTQSFAQRLNNVCALNVCESQDNMPLQRGHAYVAPGGKHLKIKRMGERYIAVVDSGEKVSGHRPSVDALFHSIAEHAKAKAIGVLLTGMGKDGAIGLLKMKQDAAFTLVQDEATSAVYGMPREAALMNAHCEQLPLDAIARRLVTQSLAS